MTRVVFDTNVLYSAILKHGSVPANAVLLIATGFVIPCVSDEVLAEYRSVLYRAELDLNHNRRRELLGTLSSFAVHVAPARKLAICAHEPDNRFLECAVEAEASYLVTGNARHFPRRYEDVEVVTPRTLLALLQ
jgi:uncharacterized protein